MITTAIRSIGLLLPTLLLTACSIVKPLGNPEMPYPPTHEPIIGDLFHVPTGSYLTQSQFYTLTSEARIVYLGESHDNPAAHRLQAGVIAYLAKRYPGRLAIGMEMFTPAQQPALDAWVAGNLTEKAFLKQSHWYTTWHMDFAYYRPILKLAHDLQIPVVGLNASKALAKAIGRNPPEKLSPEQRQQIPELDMSDPYQRALVAAIYGGHSAGSARHDGFQRVQTLWDETMASNIVKYLQSTAGENMRMVVIAGGNHVRNGFGIPKRVFRRLPTSSLLVGDNPIVVDGKRKDQLMNVNIPKFPMPAFDVIAYTKYESLPPAVKLGVLLQDKHGQVGIEKITPNSNADRAGLLAGDVISAVDGEPVREVFDLVYALQQKKPGTSIRLEFQRGKSSRVVEVKLLKSKSHKK